MNDSSTDATTSLAVATEVELDAPVREVTLLEDRAQVRRRGSVALPAGRMKVRVRDLAPVVVDRSLQAAVRTPDGAPAGERVRLIDARVRRRRRPAAGRTGVAPEARKRNTLGGDVDERIRELEAELAALAGQRNLLGKQRELVDQTVRQTLADLVTDVAWEVAAPEAWSAGLTVLGEREGELRERELELGWREEELRESLADLRRRAAAAARPDLLLVAEAEVELAVAAAGDFVLELGYVVPAACWRPAHTARLLTSSPAETATPDDAAEGRQRTEARVVFTTDACVWQKTGEDWHDVELRFSTQRPTQGHEPPLLREERIESQQKPDEVVVEIREVEIQTTGSDTGPRPAAELPGIDDGGTALTLAARERANLPSDGRPYRVPVSGFEAAAASEHVLIAELAPAVVHKVSLENAGEGPILAGPVDLIAGNGPIGRTTVLFVAPGERFDLGFGPDPAIRVQRRKDRVEAEPSVLSRHLKTEHTVTLQLSNLGTEPRTFKVRERIPISELEQVKVKLDPKATSPKAEPDDNGIISWPLTLAGGGNDTRKLRYSILKRKDVKEQG